MREIEETEKYKTIDFGSDINTIFLKYILNF